MLNLNRAQILGNLTRDPEMRYTASEQAVLNFSVATNRRWRDQNGETQDATEYHDVVVWGKQAENINPMLSKGQPVFVEGRLQTRSWEGQDGVKRYRTEIVAENVIVLGGRGSGGGGRENPVDEIASGGTKKDDSKEEDEIDIEDIPF